MEVAGYKKTWELGYRAGIAYYYCKEGANLPTYDEWKDLPKGYKDGWQTAIYAGKSNIGGNV